MDRKRYMQKIYSKYYVDAREKKYGFMEYDKNLCNYICENVPKTNKLLDVGVGTGYPFAFFFVEEGYSVYGMDISFDLIRECRKKKPQIQNSVSDAENLPFSSDAFDCTYCFHSTWYFPDLNKVIDEMIRVTRPGGVVLFDIQNRNNTQIDKAYQNLVDREMNIGEIVTRYIKNIGKLILMRGPVVWNYKVHETPTYPESVYRYLEALDISGYDVYVKTSNETIEKKRIGALEEYPRLLFSIRVPEKNGNFRAYKNGKA